MLSMRFARPRTLAFILSAALSATAFAADHEKGLARGQLQISTLSNKAHLISGGSALVRIDVPPNVALASVRVTLNGSDVTAVFKQSAADHALTGVVTGLQAGANELLASFQGPGNSGRSAALTVTNYPSKGPIASGPHLQPFICQTESFRLPDGSLLGAPLDEDCSAPTRVHYLYRSTADSAWLPLPSTTSLPADVAMTTAVDGITVPFVVRVETGTMNRGIYQNAVLHDPTAEAAPTPFSPPRGWNRRLIAVHGFGCTGGWYIQGAAQGGDILDVRRLGEGYALFTNTLNHPSNSCHAFLAGETTMMGKEHFIETFGVPKFTVSTGCSGGAYTSLQIADAFPGLFDGVLINCTFPDALSIALSALDSRLLTNYYLNGNPAGFTEGQIVAVSGHKNARAWFDLAVQSGRTDPVPGRLDPIPPDPLFGIRYTSAVWSAAVPAELRYHPDTNPAGARPTVFDVARNIYGIDPATGFALRPFDNVGVQYGLRQLNAGVISKAQFLDLNERIGGYDQDASFIAQRTVGDVGAIRRAHQSGVTLGGGGGLASIPVFDTSIIFDEDHIYHYQWFHFAARERMKDWNGHAKNHVMWRGGAPFSAFVAPHPWAIELNAFVDALSWDTFIAWVKAYRADHSNAPQLVKVLRHKPAAAVDGCFTQSTTPEFIAEPQTLSSEPDSQCNALWPSWTFPRLQAGGPMHANTLKCRLKPLDPRDYEVSFSADEWARLEAIFPQGVCDWSKRGEGEVRIVPGASFGPSPDNQVFDVTNQ